MCVLVCRVGSTQCSGWVVCGPEEVGKYQLSMYIYKFLPFSKGKCMVSTTQVIVKMKSTKVQTLGTYYNYTTHDVHNAHADIGYASQYSCIPCRGQFSLLRSIGMFRTGSAT